MRLQGRGLLQLKLVDVIVFPHLRQEFIDEGHYCRNLCNCSPKVNELLVDDERQIFSQLAYIVEYLFFLELVTLFICEVEELSVVCFY